ncbi:MAG: hypothetical protein CVV32_07825 [Methanomicrobiales archaeon HGW-Methanomicrobiales-3]|jgi:hypothetical protein|nr:MAG: hypothetical protein CVV32_07825 [Methanomicrobiales archaeon HGW-Methanomicrobiales-3]
MQHRATGRGIRILGFLFVIAVIVPALSADGIEQDQRYQPATLATEIFEINQSEINETALVKYKKTPEPITVFEVGVSETSLPGPRYMAFGPSVIGISMSPDVLGALFVLLSFGLAAVCIRAIGRWGRNGKK